MQLILGLIIGFTLASYLWNPKFKIWVNKTVFKKQTKPNESKKEEDKP